jgi:hypothetical protein
MIATPVVVGMAVCCNISRSLGYADVTYVAVTYTAVTSTV